MTGAVRRWPAALLLALFVGILLAPAGAAFAEDEAPGKAAADAEPTPEKGFTEADLMGRFRQKPKALWALGLLRILPAVVGLGLLITALIQHRVRKREGRLAPPVTARITRPFELGGALAVWAGGCLLAPPLILGFYMAGTGGDIPMWMKVLAMGLGTVAAAVLVVLRRQRLALQAADGGAGAPTVTQPPGARTALAKGLAAVCIALFLMTPIAPLWSALLEACTGERPPLQALVLLVVDPASTYEPWLIAVFGVFVAPFAEEAIFRGMLYPALRGALVKSLGSEARGTWISAVAVSVLFAAVHGSWLAAVPLFILAMVLTWLFQRTNSLAACVVAHAANNAFAMIPLLLLRLP